MQQFAVSSHRFSAVNKSEPTDIQFSFFDGEILPAGASVELQLSKEIPRFVHHVFLYRAQRLLPRDKTQEGRTVRVTTDGLEPAVYRLVVREQLDASGKIAVHHTERSFRIGALKDDIFKDYRVEHAVHLAVGDTTYDRLRPGQAAPEGKTYIAVVKAFHRATGQPKEIRLDESGKEVESNAVFAEFQERRYEKFGRIHETLFKQLEKADDDETVPVLVWPHVPEAAEKLYAMKPVDGPVTESTEIPSQLTDQVTSARSCVCDKIRECGAEPLDSKGSQMPFVQASMTPSAIRKLAKEDVGLIMLDDQSAIPDLSTQIAISRTDGAHALGFTGRGVKVAVFENGPSTLTNLDFEERYEASPSVDPDDNRHSRLTSAIIKNTQPNAPHGHAPDCELYSANSSRNAALKWAFDKKCTVISQSFHRRSEARSPDLSADDRIKDWMAMHVPFPMIVHATGNFYRGDEDMVDPPESEYVNHKGFNTISVGSHNDDATAMATSSVYRNVGDRELPEISANGTDVSAVGESGGGTSFAAPAVAGIVALMQQADTTLQHWPEACRAILFATADRNVHGSTWRADVTARVDGRDGAGAVNARSAVNVARNRRRSGGDPVGTSSGFDLGFVTNAVVDNDKFVTHRWYARTGNSLIAFGTYTIKVAIAWSVPVSGTFDNPGTSSLTVDLDLWVRNLDGSPVAVSSTFANSYEIVEFTATRGKTYEIVIRRFSGTDTTPFGVAWNSTFRLQGPLNPLPSSL